MSLCPVIDKQPSLCKQTIGGFAFALRIRADTIQMGPWLYRMQIKQDATTRRGGNYYVTPFNGRIAINGVGDIAALAESAFERSIGLIAQCYIRYVFERRE